MYIDNALLVRAGACEEQREVFRRAFPHGLNVEGRPGPAAVKRIVDNNLRVGMAALLLLTKEADEMFCLLRQQVALDFVADVNKLERLHGLSSPAFEQGRRRAWRKRQRRLVRIAWSLFADPKNARL